MVSSLGLFFTKLPAERAIIMTEKIDPGYNVD